jgi:hypothetical protein
MLLFQLFQHGNVLALLMTLKLTPETVDFINPNKPSGLQNK